MQEPEVRVGYNKVFGVLMLVVGGLCFALGLLTHGTLSMLIGAMNAGIGVLYLVRPYFVLAPGAVELKNLFGMTMRRYEFADLAELARDPDGKNIFHAPPSGPRTRLHLTRWLADKRDWQRFLGTLEVRAFE